MIGGVWVYSTLVFSFGILGLIEFFIPENKSNDADEDENLPNIILWLHVLAQTACIISFFLLITKSNVQWWEMMGAAISTAVNSGSSAIVVAHEFIHRKNFWSQLAGKYLLFTAGNFYFFVQHLKVHHKWVGTSKDPATSFYNESLYRFYWRTTREQIVGAWKIEKERMIKNGWSVWNARNYVALNFILLLILLIALFLISYKVALVFLLHFILANFLLEYINYIEHYGLARNENERVTEIHSWQSDKWVSRFFLIDLSRHSDHHYYASKPYHTLKTYEKSPVLPGGYASCIYFALIPALWFSIMNKRIEQFKFTESV